MTKGETIISVFLILYQFHFLVMSFFDGNGAYLFVYIPYMIGAHEGKYCRFLFDDLYIVTFTFMDNNNNDN